MQRRTLNGTPTTLVEQQTNLVEHRIFDPDDSPAPLDRPKHKPPSYDIPHDIMCNILACNLSYILATIRTPPSPPSTLTALVPQMTNRWRNLRNTSALMDFHNPSGVSLAAAP